MIINRKESYIPAFVIGPIAGGLFVVLPFLIVLHSYFWVLALIIVGMFLYDLIINREYSIDSVGDYQVPIPVVSERKQYLIQKYKLQKARNGLSEDNPYKELINNQIKELECLLNSSNDKKVSKLYAQTDKMIRKAVK